MPAETTPTTFMFTELKKFEKVRQIGSKIAALRVFATGAGKHAIVLTERDDFLGMIVPTVGMEENRMPQWMPPLAPYSVAAGPAAAAAE
jgi:hypothetical protein